MERATLKRHWTIGHATSRGRHYEGYGTVVPTKAALLRQGYEGLVL